MVEAEVPGGFDPFTGDAMLKSVPLHFPTTYIKCARLAERLLLFLATRLVRRSEQQREHSAGGAAKTGRGA